MKIPSDETLDFIVNPTYAKIKDKLPIILEEWIKEYGEEYRQEITKKFNKINYILVTKERNLVEYFDSLQLYLYNFIHKNFYESLGYELDYFGGYIFTQEKGIFHSELGAIYKNGNYFSLNKNEALLFLNTKVRAFLVEKIDNFTRSNDYDNANIVSSSLIILDGMMREYEGFYEKFKDTFKNTNDYKRKAQDEKETLMNEAINNSLFNLLLKEDTELIKNNIQFKVDSLKSVDLLFDPLLHSNNALLSIGYINYFSSEYTKKYQDSSTDSYSRRSILNRRHICLDALGIDSIEIDVMDTEKCIEKMKPFFNNSFNFETIDSYIANLKETIDEINKNYMENPMFLKFTVSDNKVSKNILGSEMLERPQNQIFANHYNLSFEEEYAYVNRVLKSLKKQELNCCFFNNISVEDVSGSELPCIFIQSVFPGGSLYTNVEENLIHEIGHAITLNNFNYTNGKFDDGLYISGSNYRFRNINELVNQYLTLKIKNRMRENNHFIIDDKDFINNHPGSYGILLFLLEPFEVLMDYFKRASIKSNLNYLLAILGPERFDQYINIVNEVFDKSNKMMPRNILKESPEYISNVKQTLEEILSEIKENIFSSSMLR